MKENNIMKTKLLFLLLLVLLTSCVNEKIDCTPIYEERVITDIVSLQKSFGGTSCILNTDKGKISLIGNKCYLQVGDIIYKEEKANDNCPYVSNSWRIK